LHPLLANDGIMEDEIEGFLKNQMNHQKIFPLVI